MTIRNDRMTHESSLCWSLYIAWGFADSEIDGEDKDFFALEVRVMAARSCYSRSRRCIVGTAGDWKRLYDAWNFPWFIEQKRWWKRIWKWPKREKKKSITFRRVNLAFVICMKFLAAVLPSSFEVHGELPSHNFPKVTSCFGWRRTWTGCNRSFSLRKYFTKWRDLMDKRYEAKCSKTGAE